MTFHSSEYNQYLELCNEIIHHNRLYFELGAPSITDREYDLLFEKLKEIEKEHPEWVSDSSPSRKIGEGAYKATKVNLHLSPMLSFDKVFSHEKVHDFHEKMKRFCGGDVTYSVEAKIDGCALSLWYVDGVFNRALTRGDGFKGDNVSSSLLKLSEVPSRLLGKSSKFVEVRGEVYMSFADLEKLNEERSRFGLPIMFNTRNCVAGLLRKNSDSLFDQASCMKFFSYYLFDDSLMTVSQMRDRSISYGLTPVSSFKSDCSIEEVTSFIDDLCEKRSSLPYQIDGVVIKLERLELHLQLGFNGQNYKWGIAYKYAPKSARTQVKDITLQVGRTGIITPVAELCPVFLDGSLVSRSTLHNLCDLQKKDVRIGDYVWVEKSGDIIPRISSVDLKARDDQLVEWDLPEVCPVCRSVLGEDGSVFRCTNPSCLGKSIANLLHFVSKEGMDISGFGRSTIMQLIDRGLISEPADIYKLSESDLSSLDRSGLVLGRKIFAAIISARIRPLDKFISALGIRYVGKITARLLSFHFESWDRLKKATLDEILAVPGVGCQTAESLVSFFSDEEFAGVVSRLFSAGVRVEISKPVLSESLFRSKIFVITGSFKNFSRNEIELLITYRGGVISSSISKKTMFLVVGENPGSKLEKAHKLRVRTINESQFCAML